MGIYFRHGSCNEFDVIPHKRRVPVVRDEHTFAAETVIGCHLRTQRRVFNGALDVPARRTGREDLALDLLQLAFQRVKQPPSKLLLLGVSAARTVSFPLPEATLKTTNVGCGSGRIVVQTANPKTKSVELSTCDLDGKCSAPLNDPFRDWPEPHEHEIQTVGLGNGVVGVLSEHVGARWGLYLAASGDGITYERPRVIGEGTGDRGRVELGALIPFGKRVVEGPHANSTMRLVFNVIWLLCAGWEIALCHVAGAAALAVTIIGIPFAIQHLKLIPLALFPFGRDLR